MSTAKNSTLVRDAVTLNSDYEDESTILSVLELTGESNRGKLARALVRAGVKVGRGGDHSTSDSMAPSGGAPNDN